MISFAETALIFPLLLLRSTPIVLRTKVVKTRTCQHLDVAQHVQRCSATAQERSRRATSLSRRLPQSSRLQNRDSYASLDTWGFLSCFLFISLISFVFLGILMTFTTCNDLLRPITTNPCFYTRVLGSVMGCLASENTTDASTVGRDAFDT